MSWELILKSREDTFRETATLRLDGAIADIVETLQSMGASRTETRQVFISAMEQLMANWKMKNIGWTDMLARNPNYN
jgi:hypothetical protein